MMEGITGYVYLFGINIPITELLLLLSLVIIVYLAILEFEFRQIRKITKKFDDEELILTKSIRELRDSVSELRNTINVGRNIERQDNNKT
ncbi:MAG: hypothetical protein J7J15_03370 [Candidatus Aenigmarchaeota archaeon]|nr:hypothetical protein [Candidatus Aenigmarchaeota archaeon]